MIPFQEMFEKTKGMPILYNGKTLVLGDDFPRKDANRLRLSFESCNATWRQGVSFRFRGKGKFLINGQDVKHVVCWQDSAPESFEFELVSKEPTIYVYNVWDVGDGVTHAWHNCAAMIVEDVPNGRRYRCNDGFPDDDFDDIVFRLERIGHGP